MGRLDESKNGDVTADGKAASARMLGYVSSVARSLNRGSGASSGGGAARLCFTNPPGRLHGFVSPVVRQLWYHGLPSRLFRTVS
jgi:hypothetical protein